MQYLEALSPSSPNKTLIYSSQSSSTVIDMHMYNGVQDFIVTVCAHKEI